MSWGTKLLLSVATLKLQLSPGWCKMGNNIHMHPNMQQKKMSILELFEKLRIYFSNTICCTKGAEIWQHYIGMPKREWYSHHQPDAIGKEEEDIY